MPTWVTDLVQLAPWLAAVAVVAYVIVRVWPLVRKLGHFLDDVAGEPERPGVPARPGLMERIGRIEHEVFPNSGKSLRDAVDRQGQKLDTALAWQAKHEEKSDAALARIDKIDKENR